MPRLVLAVPAGACREGVVGSLVKPVHRGLHFSARINESSIRDIRYGISVPGKCSTGRRHDFPLSYCQWRQSQSFPTWPRGALPRISFRCPRLLTGQSHVELIMIIKRSTCAMPSCRFLLPATYFERHWRAVATVRLLLFSSITFCGNIYRNLDCLIAFEHGCNRGRALQRRGEQDGIPHLRHVPRGCRHYKDEKRTTPTGERSVARGETTPRDSLGSQDRFQTPSFDHYHVHYELSGQEQYRSCPFSWASRSTIERRTESRKHTVPNRSEYSVCGISLDASPVEPVPEQDRQASAVSPNCHDHMGRHFCRYSRRAKLWWIDCHKILPRIC